MPPTIHNNLWLLKQRRVTSFVLLWDARPQIKSKLKFFFSFLPWDTHECSFPLISYLSRLQHLILWFSGIVAGHKSAIDVRSLAVLRADRWRLRLSCWAASQSPSSVPPTPHNLHKDTPTEHSRRTVQPTSPVQCATRRRSRPVFVSWASFIKESKESISANCNLVHIVRFAGEDREADRQTGKQHTAE